MLKKHPVERESLICFPEYFATGFTLSPGKTAERASGPTSEFLSQVATEHSCYVIGSSIMKSSKDPKPRNSALVFSPKGKKLVQYDKTHLFSPGGEKNTYSSGTKVSAFQVRDRLFSVLLCFDLRFPELFRILYEKNVSGIFVLANWPAARHHHWSTLLRARAIENQCFVFGVNRTGSDVRYRYSGGSAIIDPSGHVLSQSRKSTVVSAEIDIEQPVRERHSFPVKKERQIHLYKKYKPYK